MGRSLQKITKLRMLKLEGCKFMADGLKAIGSSCVSIRELSLSKCSGVTDTELSFAVSKLKNLLKLDITCCRNITDVSVAAITSSCTSLISLRMESCSHVSSGALQLIGKHCPHLEELDLTDRVTVIWMMQVLTELAIDILFFLSNRHKVDYEYFFVQG